RRFQNNPASAEQKCDLILEIDFNTEWVSLCCSHRGKREQQSPHTPEKLHTYFNPHWEGKSQVLSGKIGNNNSDRDRCLDRRMRIIIQKSKVFELKVLNPFDCRV